MYKILILGDLFPKAVENYPNLPENDFCVANLECAICDNLIPISKDGPNLCISKNETEVLKKINLNLVGLANNHVMDYGANGLHETISNLDNLGIKHAGSTCDCNYFIWKNGANNVGFYFVSEHQYNYDKKEKTGVNLLKHHDTFNEITTLRNKCDVLIVLFHGGKEYYHYPTPNQQNICHKFVDSGADFVVCQHSHCVGSLEEYKGCQILYGQGNFMFPFRDNEAFKSGLIIELLIDDNNHLKSNFLPVVHVEKETVRFANESEKQKIMESLNQHTIKLFEKGSEVLFDDLVSTRGLDFLYRLFNKSKLYIRLDNSKLFKNRMIKRYIAKNKRYFAYLTNYFTCETHIEYIKAILDKFTQSENK